MKYSHYPEGKHLGDHYDAIVYIEIPTEEVQYGEQMKKEVRYRTLKIIQVKKTRLQSPNRMNTEKKKSKKKKKYEKHSLNIHLFTNVIPVV